MVMVSYSWNEKEPARQIYAALKASGINAWIDYYNMTYANNLPQTMGETVEDSTVIVVCYSEAYQNSSNCRQEALYSFQLKKKQVFAKVQEDFTPTGWLGFILAGHQYYNFYNESVFDENFEKLLGNVEEGLNGSEGKMRVSLAMIIVSIAFKFILWSFFEIYSIPTYYWRNHFLKTRFITRIYFFNLIATAFLQALTIGQTANYNSGSFFFSFRKIFWLTGRLVVTAKVRQARSRFLMKQYKDKYELQRSYVYRRNAIWGDF